MFKFGICELADFDAHGLTPRWLAERRFVAVSLYRDIARSDRPDRDALLERVLVRFATRNASLKRTQSARFGEFDAGLVGLIQERYEPGKIWRVHDAGVSDGRTAADLFARLDAIEGFEFRFQASDYAPDVLVVADRQSSLELAIDPVTEELLQIVWPPFVLDVQQGESPLLFPVNHLVRRALLRRRVPELLERWKRDEGTTTADHLWLLHPRCDALREREERFEFVRFDLLAPTDRRFELVRAMNVLNPTYFSEAQLHTAVRNVADSLEPGGLFVTGSNEDAGSTVNGAVYLRTAQGFERLMSSGSGSPVDRLTRAVSEPSTAR
jgi:chemotaxis methyl-accepting protein methylase